MSKQKLLVTGSCGFIFSNFVRLALKDNYPYEIVSIDKVTRPSNLHNVYANRGHKFYLGDVTDRHFIDTVFRLEKPDLVVHGAAESHVDDSISNPNVFIISNVLGTQVMLDMALKHGVKRFVYISTDEVYGQLADDNAEGWSEEDCMAPRNPYSASKASGEILVRAANQTHGLPFNITRCCNNFGPRQSTKNFIPKIIKCILNKEKIPIYGQGLQMREWIHVADNCQAVYDILEKAPPNETYNISTGFESTNLELVNDICNIMGEGHDLISFVEDRPGHDFRYCVRNDKISGLGWKPSFKFKRGLELCIKWYTKNQWYMH
jgi:dTDP-glucose 4,6-dehydratase